MTMAWLITPLFVAGMVFVVVSAVALIVALVANPRGTFGEFVSWFTLACLAFVAAATLALASGVTAWPFNK